MAIALKTLTDDEPLAQGHRLCAGCGASIAARMALKMARGPTIAVNATGCLEVATTIYPYTAWRIPWVHVAFENVAAVASGIEAGFRGMVRRGGWDKVPDIIAFAGDGGTFDIGLQALSGALERGHDFVYICYDNEAYMNTGIQRSGSTPHGASTTTSPSGSKIPGKPEWKKDLAAICAAHGIEYVATASVAYWNDYMTKVKKAIDVNGPAFIHVMAPCPRGWRCESADSIKMARLAVQTRLFPIYEIEKGKYKLSMKVPKPSPVEELLKAQGRFTHLFRPENTGEIARIEKWVDDNWVKICQLCGEPVTPSITT
jgi:pyruvate ferredoxin oxidoreductase beta subunit